MKHIASRDNTTLKHLYRLAQSSSARKREQETLLDGAHLISAALAHQIPFQALLTLEDENKPAEFLEIIAQAQSQNIEIITLPGPLFAHISPVDTPSGLMAWINWPERENLPRAANESMLILDAIQDPGNLGTLMRTAAAAGIVHVGLTPGCAQAWSPRVLRAAMGAHFLLHITEALNAPETLSAFNGEILATVPEDSATTLYQLDLRGPIAWLVGAEGQGLTPTLKACATQTVRIPMPGAMESLNVAAATAICLFEQVRQKNT